MSTERAPIESARAMTLVNVSAPLPAGAGGARDIYLPLGCLYLVSALERAGLGVEFRDYQVYSADAEDPLDPELFQRFMENPAPIVGVSCMVSMLPFVILAMKRFKEEHPECAVVLGGPGPSGAAEAIVAAMPWIDVVARGEGEETIVELVRALSRGEGLGGVKGIVFRDGGRVVGTPPRPRIADLDSLPMPAYQTIDFTPYTSVSVVTGRGCPFKCSFCDVGPLWNNRTRFRSIPSVVAELELLAGRYGRRTIHIADDTFDLSRRRTEEFCEAVKPLSIAWSCLARVDLMDASLLSRMRDAGCDSVFLGIESGSDAVLRAIGKRFMIREALEKVELSCGNFDRVITSFIWGFPFETLDDLKSTILAIVAVWSLGGMAGLKLLSPMPLSRLGVEYRDRIAFDPELCSVFASLGYGGSRRGGGGAIPGDLERLIRAHPDIFMGFYYIESDELREKARYIRRFSEKRNIQM